MKKNLFFLLYGLSLLVIVGLLIEDMIVACNKRISKRDETIKKYCADIPFYPYEDQCYVNMDEIYDEALKSMSEEAAPNSTDMAKALNNLGNAMRFQGRHEESHQLYTEAFTFLKESPGESGEEIIIVQANLASLDKDIKLRTKPPKANIPKREDVAMRQFVKKVSYPDKAGSNPATWIRDFLKDILKAASFLQHTISAYK